MEESSGYYSAGEGSHFSKQSSRSADMDDDNDASSENNEMREGIILGNATLDKYSAKPKPIATVDKYSVPSNTNQLGLVCKTLYRLTRAHASQNLPQN